MIFETKDHLQKVLTNMQNQACAYGTPDRPAKFCDCKYGGDKLGSTGEQGNGCPELRAVIALLSVMTPAEYMRLQLRHRNRQEAEQRAASFTKKQPSKKTSQLLTEKRRRR